MAFLRSHSWGMARQWFELLPDFVAWFFGHQAALDKTDKLRALKELILWGWEAVKKATIDKPMSDSEKSQEKMSGGSRRRGSAYT